MGQIGSELPSASRTYFCNLGGNEREREEKRIEEKRRKRKRKQKLHFFKHVRGSERKVHREFDIFLWSRANLL